jgi:hypothetical protein
VQRKFRKKSLQNIQVAPSCGFSIGSKVRAELGAVDPVVRSTVEAPQPLYERAIDSATDGSKSCSITRNAQRPFVFGIGASIEFLGKLRRFALKEISRFDKAR